MKPTYATQCLLRLGEWIAETHYCIKVALFTKQHGDPINAEWWLARAKLHGNAMRLMQQEYSASVSLS